MVLNLLAGRAVSPIVRVDAGPFSIACASWLVIGNSLPTAFMLAVQVRSPGSPRSSSPLCGVIGNGAGFSESIRHSADRIDLYECRLLAAAGRNQYALRRALTTPEHSGFATAQTLRIERECAPIPPRSGPGLGAGAAADGGGGADHFPEPGTSPAGSHHPAAAHAGLCLFSQRSARY